MTSQGGMGERFVDLMRERLQHPPLPLFLLRTIALSTTRSSNAITSGGSPIYSDQLPKSRLVTNAVEPWLFRLSTTLYNRLGDSGYSRRSSLSKPNSSMIKSPRIQGLSRRARNSPVASTWKGAWGIVLALKDQSNDSRLAVVGNYASWMRRSTHCWRCSKAGLSNNRSRNSHDG